MFSGSIFHSFYSYPFPQPLLQSGPKKCCNFGMDPRLYDVHLLLKPRPLGDKRRMFCFFGPPCSIALIKTDIKTTVAPMEDTYLTTAELKLTAALDFIPASLRFLFQHLFVGKDTSRNVPGIGQAVVQAVRPRAVNAPFVKITILD